MLNPLLNEFKTWVSDVHWSRNDWVCGASLFVLPKVKNWEHQKLKTYKTPTKLSVIKLLTKFWTADFKRFFLWWALLGTNRGDNSGLKQIHLIREDDSWLGAGLQSESELTDWASNKINSFLAFFFVSAAKSEVKRSHNAALISCVTLCITLMIPYLGLVWIATCGL